jgi:hypothetical protein
MLILFEAVFLKGLFNIIIRKKTYDVKKFCECLQMIVYPTNI